MTVLALTAIRWLLIIVLGAEKSKFKVPEDSVNGESPLPSLSTATLSRCSRVAFPQCLILERGGVLLSLPVHIKTFIPSGRPHPQDPI